MIAVIGSSNMDLVVNTKRAPEAGETLLGTSFFMSPGGKGANQAVAIARLGGVPLFVSKLGSDVFGRQLREHFLKENMDVSYVFETKDDQTGVASITVDAKGENRIIVMPGANEKLLPGDVQLALSAIDGCEWVVLQQEIPLQTIRFVIDWAYKKGKRVILNPAPASQLMADIYSQVAVLTPNETELEVMTGMKTRDKAGVLCAARCLLSMGASQVIVTLGANGSLVCSEYETSWIPARKVQPVDTTAAGDVFNGALAVALAEGRELKEAVRFATVAASVAVTRPGAQTSVPYREEIDRLFNF